MAQRRTTSLVDDLTGGAADETVRFGLGGPEYEIDLTAVHAAELRRALMPYVAKARRIRPGRATSPTRPTRLQPLRIGVTVDPEWVGHASL